MTASPLPAAEGLKVANALSARAKVVEVVQPPLLEPFIPTPFTFYPDAPASDGLTIIDSATGTKLPFTTAIYDSGADMNIIGQHVADQWGLDYQASPSEPCALVTVASPPP